MPGDTRSGTASSSAGLVGGWAASWWQPWTALALFSFGLHYVWETLHVSLYDGVAEQAHAAGVVCCLRAAAGDVVIALVSYGAVAALTRNRLWLADPRLSRVGGYVGVGLVITVAMELLSANVWGRWTYAPAMPTVLGLGVSPLLQWLVLPPVALWFARRHLALSIPRPAASRPVIHPSFP